MNDHTEEGEFREIYGLDVVTIPTNIPVKRIDENDIFFIGGARVYNECKKYCNTAYITKINNEYKADTFIENLDKDNDWQIISTKEIDSKKNIKISFNIYKKNEKSVL